MLLNSDVAPFAAAIQLLQMRLLQRMATACSSFSYDTGTGCLLDSAGSIDTSAPYVGSCGPGPDECTCASPVTADTQSCSAGTSDTTPKLFDSAGLF